MLTSTSQKIESLCFDQEGKITAIPVIGIFTHVNSPTPSYVEPSGRFASAVRFENSLVYCLSLKQYFASTEAYADSVKSEQEKARAV